MLLCNHASEPRIGMDVPDAGIPIMGKHGAALDHVTGSPSLHDF